MQTITVEEIDGKLKTLSADKLTAVYHFVSYLADQDFDMLDISAKELMFASESSITKDWDTPEEDKAWADL
ncbi:MAG: hypothetical protein ABJA66_13620 [Actinomycetota bacterium]